ncbi:prenyltransferase [Clostridium lacusfryxellense]|uniref:prenyltransferase n=1 Tax=Clostridium lacusfryxellense TaxID=205328 RepID=UPI001C0E3C96|nr:prenyltransferase [Clostridium lacusfryxellense]MBU3113394.1 prenyltransferase [Clostridium lacusfryxellense]
MIKRLNIYLNEMYPVIPRLILGFIMFFEIYFLVILTNGSSMGLDINLQEIIGAVTVFGFLLSLRIADEFKDYETDLIMFPERSFPSGRVKKNDLVTLLTIVCVVVITLNLIFMNNIIYFVILAVYGVVMSVWFFSKTKIQKSLPLALITHNPVQLILNLYVISFTCIKYNINIFTLNNLIILLTLYFPGLIWEISRKTRAPKDENDYTTYSKLFGFKKATKFIMIVMVFDMITSSILVYQIYPIAVVTVIGSYIWFLKQGTNFIKDPTRFKLVDKVIVYEYITELTLVIIELIYIVTRWII